MRAGNKLYSTVCVIKHADQTIMFQLNKGLLFNETRDCYMQLIYTNAIEC